MKVYPNFKKYFNTTSRSYLKALMMLNIVSLVFTIIMMDMDAYFHLIPKLIVQVIFNLIFWGYFYSTQLTLKRAHIGKSLKKRLGDSDSMVQALEQMEEEMEQPVYSNFSPRRKNNNFVITKNWIIGAQGMLFFRANAVPLSDVIKVEHQVVVYRGRHSGSFFALTVTDKENKKYEFLLKDEDDLGDAFIEIRKFIEGKQNAY